MHLEFAGATAPFALWYVRRGESEYRKLLDSETCPAKDIPIAAWRSVVAGVASDSSASVPVLLTSSAPGTVRLVLRYWTAAGGAFVREQFQSTPSLLTVREMDVLRLLAQGKQRDQIAAALGIGAESVKTHLKGIMNKLACPNATSAVGRAYELGILRA